MDPIEEPVAGDPVPVKKPAGKKRPKSQGGKKKGRPRGSKKPAAKALVECPSCKVLIPKGSKECPSCRTSLLVASEPEEAEPVETQAPHPAEEPRAPEPAPEKEMAPETPAEVEGLPRPESAPEKEMTPEVPAQVAEELEPRHAEPEEKTTAEAIPETVPVLPKEEEEQAEDESATPDQLRACPSCGTVSSVSFEKCPWCNASFAEARAPTEPSKEAAEAPKPPSPVPEAKQVKKRTLKTAKVTAAPAPTSKGETGLAKGVGQVNGLGVAKRERRVKRESLVNGNGVPESPRKRPADSAVKRTSFLTRWQFLAVLVVVAVIISTFAFLSYSEKGGKYSVDGDFSEWNDATIYGTMVQSSASTSNITEWAVGSQGSDLFLYFRTQSNAMSTTNAESYYLFVDADGSNATGYIVESIGADYVLQMTGWDSAVKGASLLRYSTSTDQYNWNAWTSSGSMSCSLDGTRIEAGATLPSALSESARFVLVSKDYADRGSISYTAPSKGGLLVVRETLTANVSGGTVERSSAVAVLSLSFSCEGAGGQVTQVNPVLQGAQIAGQVSGFPLAKGEKHAVTVYIDTSASNAGQLVSAYITESSIVSDFACVQIIGSGASVYAVSPPSSITIDGAFADWSGRLSLDQDQVPVTNSNLDINEVGNLSTSSSSFFYVSVEGEICSGTFIPATVAKPSSSGGGGAVVLTRQTAEDVLNVYVDSDRSNSTGKAVEMNSKLIGADQKIEVKGLFGKITSVKEFNYSTAFRDWVAVTGTVEAAKDEKRIEIGVGAGSLGGSTDIDFIVETTSWKGRSDLATFDPASALALARHWIVDPASTSPYATSMSYQRKMFYDGVNYWSFYFDGANTVLKYSVDEGMTWVPGGQVFRTPGINETSVWYDRSTGTVYAVGDASSASIRVAVQAGIVDADAHKIAWAASDSSLNTSAYALAGKNTYVCKDANGYLWVLSSNLTQTAPAAHQLSAFRSLKVNATGAWVFSGQMLAATSAADNVKGSVVPAGSGSDVWAIYTYTGTVAARKYTGAWQPQQIIYTQVGSKANSDNSPPSVVVDGKGVVHVVYGTGRKAGQVSTPTIEYSHNLTGLTTFTAGVNLDPLIATGIGDYYPTITLDSATGDLYALWLQSDSSQVPKTIVCKVYSAGTWTGKTIDEQTTYAKTFLTSVYSVPGEFKVCWQWTQNATAPIEVFYDSTQVPELGGVAFPIVMMIAFFAFYRRGRGVPGSRGTDTS